VFFDRLIGLGLVIVIHGACSRLIYCRVLLRSLLVLAVLILAYVLVGVAPASALPTLVDWAAVRGTDNGVYVASYGSDGSWSSWGSLGGATLSPPGICEDPGFGTVYVAVRGTNNGIYLKSWSNSLGWSAGWASPGGATIDTPACVALGGTLYVVVRGTNNELYWNSITGNTWSGWQDLNGASASAPVLALTPAQGAGDLFIQGTDNRIYHQSFTTAHGSWSGSWDHAPGGATPSRPAAARSVIIECNPGPPCAEEDEVLLVVRGTDNNIYAIDYLVAGPGIPTGGEWGYKWSGLGGTTFFAPAVAYAPHSCDLFSTVSCTSYNAIVVRGSDNAVYINTLADFSFSGWYSMGGSIANSPALAYISGTQTQFLLLVEGNPSKNLYSNTIFGLAGWDKYSSVGGATNSDPALSAVL